MKRILVWLTILFRTWPMPMQERHTLYWPLLIYFFYFFCNYHSHTTTRNKRLRCTVRKYWTIFVFIVKRCFASARRRTRNTALAHHCVCVWRNSWGAPRVATEHIVSFAHRTHIHVVYVASLYSLAATRVLVATDRARYFFSSTARFKSAKYLHNLPTVCEDLNRANYVFVYFIVRSRHVSRRASLVCFKCKIVFLFVLLHFFFTLPSVLIMLLLAVQIIRDNCGGCAIWGVASY